MKQIYRLVLPLVGLWFGASTTGAAFENAIKQIQTRQEGDQVLLKVQMASPLKALPGSWSVVEPARLVFDFPDVENQSGQTGQKLNIGDLKSLNIVQTEKLTRLVLNLHRSTKYSSELVGDVLFVKLQTQSLASSRESAPSVYQAQVPKNTGFSAVGAAIRDISFRRGSEGEGLILIDLTDGSIPVDIRRSGNGLAVELRGVELPEKLLNRRDVNDFATPVKSISSRVDGDSVRLDIQAQGRWFHQARVNNNLLTIEVKVPPLGDENKLVQTGQQGKRVSINFFDADAAMVLRTLAEISGKNVLIDPSLSGRRVTANLDNLPYDQALEIVMTQVNAAKRIRGDVVVFGDRAALQKRDQDLADEEARAADTAPLVSETFTLSYIKPSELATLIQVNTAQAGGSKDLVKTEFDSKAQPTSKDVKGGGMLSARGSLGVHDLTQKLFLKDTASVVEAVREIIRNVDIPGKQVMIEARIVEASTGFSNALGVRLKFFGNPVASLGGGVKGALGTPSTAGFSNVDAFGAPAVPSLIRPTTQGFGTNFNANGTTAINFMLFNNAATRLLSLELLAAEADNRNKTVSAPRLLTQNRKSAKVNNTQQVTLLVGVNAQTGLPIYQTYSAPLTLEVTPSITPDNKVSMELKIEKGTITNANTGSLDANTLNTNVIVDNGGTVVIGGFARDSEISSEERVPLLGDLPYVGFLFKAKSRVQNRSELLVFITPRIVTDSLVQR
ncbi:MAG: type IV pilus secretin PilQ [Rhodocyclales bacterium]|nr:type IV pilus secretin PilQ [Rhodocyclales bacterium]MBH1974702.1 type IV pilus secretin PilQ [Rhodocyclales bacterium]